MFDLDPTVWLIVMSIGLVFLTAIVVIKSSALTDDDAVVGPVSSGSGAGDDTTIAPS